MLDVSYACPVFYNFSCIGQVMSVLSLSEVQSAGEPGVRTKAVESILGEPSLLPEGFSRQQTREKPSHAILDMDVTPMEICCAQQIPIPEFDQFNERHFGNGRLRGLASDPCRSSGELPIGIHVIGELLPKIPPHSLQGKGELSSKQERNASILKADSLKLESNNLMSNGISNMENSFPKEKLCIDGMRHLENKELCFLFDSKNGKRGRCGVGGGRLESKNSLCDSGKDVIFLEDVESNEINKSKGIMTAISNDKCIPSDTSNSHSEDNGFHRNLYYPTEIECRAGYEKGDLTAEDINNNIQKMEENAHEGEPTNLGNVYLDEHRSLPLWVKWRGKWQTGFRCPTVDCPLSTLRAKPTHERKKYISIFFPRTRTYSWVDLLLVCPIDEFPEPLAYGTHRRWRKLVKDLSTPRRYIMQKLAVAMLNISDQLHTEAVIEDARRTTAWKEFAMDASRCKAYPSLGQMLLKLQKMILPHCISKDWLQNSFDCWVQRCRNAPSAESIEKLTQELVESVLWSKVDELWNAPVQPELGPEWKTWKQEAMKCFFASHLRASVQDVEHNSTDISVKGEPQTSRKRVKLEIRRPETSASKIEVSDCQRVSHIESLDNNCEHDVCEDLFELPLNCEPHKMVALPRVAAATGSGSTFDRGKESALEGKGAGLQSAVSTSADGVGCKELMLHASDQSDSSNRYRQCLAFIEAKGRQCGRWANDGDIYCCVHLAFHSVRKHPQMDQMLPIEAPMCQGTTTHGNKCKHRARYNSTFCKKHWFQGNQSSVTTDTLLLSSADTSQRKQREDRVPENLYSSNATGGQELSLVREAASSAEENLIPIIVEETLDERNCLMKQSELCNALPTVKGISSEIQHCIGHHGHSNGGQCHEFPRRHTLYCEKHLPRFLKRARNGKSRLISKDIFINLLKSCSSRKQKLCLHQACELLYGFLKSGLSCQKFLLRGDNVAWILAEASKDVNVGEYLLKLVTYEREKIMGLWDLSCDLDKQASKEINSFSTMNQDSQRTLKCKICAEEFSDDHMLVRHWTEVHKKEARWLFKGYACAVCMNLFTNRKVLETHVIEKHGVQFLEHSIVVRCVSCSSHFASPEKLWQHVFSFHLTELRLPDFNPSNCSLSEDKVAQTMIGTTIKLCQNKSVLEKDDDSQKYFCRFCGLKFDRLPDLGRHHQVAHMIPYSASHFSSKRRNYFLKRTKANHSRYWKKIGSAFRFKDQSNRVMLENFQSFSSVSQVKPKLYKQPCEVVGFEGLSESNCCNVAETLFSKIQRTKQRPSNLEILSFARSACCRTSLDAALVEYGVLPENIYLKAAKLCSELNIQVGWHQEGFICPRGCKPVTKPYLLAPLTSLSSMVVEPPKIESRNDVKWEIDECHYILSAQHFDWKQRRESIVLCKDVSFGKEAIPVACVVDEDLKHLLTIDVSEDSCTQKPWLSMPWLGYTYATERLIDPSFGLDSKSSQLGCACPQMKCYPENCDHVYLFDNDYDNAVDIHGKLMQGRFPYDDQGRILLEEGYLVYECNSMCSCDMTCKNRVLQKGIQVKLEIFRTEKKGWAVRAGEVISRGTFVCEYIGVLNTSGTHKRGQSIECSYLYDIDAHIDGARGLSEGMVPCVIDATKYGNVSRFINHSCLPNLVNYLVLVESMDCQLAHVGLFANRDIDLGEELAYDYRYKLLPGEEGLRCHCQAPCCRGRLY